jgi:PASTA domain
MAARLSALLPRLAALTLIWLLATSTMTFAAAGRAPRTQSPAMAAPAPRATNVLVVPDVRRQAYVFAKGILEDGGFAWRVTGSVRGYAANTVVSQRPAPGTKVVDTGAPTIVLRLQRNAAYAENGLPENSSQYRGTRIVLPGAAPAPAPAPQAPAEPAPANDAPQEPAPAEPAPPAPEEEPAGDGGREPAFVVPGAPREPRGEMPLPDRARLLEKRLAAHPRPTKDLVQYWLYQHAWVVTGARFGWSGGAEALRVLVRVDRDLEARWGVGARSAAIARAALAEVEAKSES